MSPAVSKTLAPDEPFSHPAAGTLDAAQSRAEEPGSEPIVLPPGPIETIEAVDAIVRRVGHDFNNVLLAVRGYGQLALRGLERDLDVSNDIKEMIAAADRGAGLVRELRRFRRQLVVEAREHKDSSAVVLRDSEGVA